MDFCKNAMILHWNECLKTAGHGTLNAKETKTSENEGVKKIVTL